MEKLRRFTCEEVMLITNGFAADRKIGEGRFAIVFEGMFKGEMVAVKKLSISNMSYRQMFENEKLMLSHFKHANIVKCFGFGEITESLDEKAGFVVLEHVPYSLVDVIQGTRRIPEIKWVDFISIMSQISKALEYVHTFKTPKINATHVYVDLKPANIMFWKENEVCTAKLIDLGSIIQSGKMIGAYTKECAAPEVLRSGTGLFKSDVTAKADVYGFGDTLLKVVSMDNYVATSTNIPYKDGRGYVSRFVKQKWNLDEAKMIGVSNIILDCRKKAPNQRPDMRQVRERLDALN